ncbi:MAG: hypothetical protein ACI9EW_002648 [Cellvibrionaceae bacterium]|jgi:hypothetical protein
MKSVSSSPPPANDEILPLTRIIAAVIIPFLVAAFIILYFFPAQSAVRFAWEIKPAMTAVWMGAGYLGGAYFFLRVALDKEWHRVAGGFWAVTAFTWAMLLTTVLHWSRFDLNHLPFQIWLVLYVITPFLVPFIWWRNRSAAPRTLTGDEIAVPLPARIGMAIIGVLMLMSCLICYFAPDVAIVFWPWALTPLTARVMGGWFALMGVGGLMMAQEPRWSGWKYEIESIIFVWHALVLIGAFIYADDFKPNTAWFFIAEAGAILGLLGFYLMMQRRR